MNKESLADIRRTEIVLVLILLACLPAAAKQYYVSPAGSDLNSGTSMLPFRTIQHAADVVNPGDRVIVRNGTYNDASKSGAGSKLISMTRGGTSGSYVVFRAEHKWGAVLDGLDNTTAEAWTFSPAANYIRVQDFEVRGFSDTGFSNWGGGHDIQLAGNNIHDIGRYCTDTTHGRVGIFVHAGPILIEQNRIHDIGRYSPGENGCRPSTPYYQNNDHGIYIDAANNVTIRNNVFYNTRHGWSIHVYPKPVANLAILNNTFAFVNRWRIGHIVLAAPVSNARIANNIFYQPNTAAIYFHAPELVSPGSDSVFLSNNISTNAIATTQASEPLAGRNAAHTGMPGVTYSTNQEHSDPLLVSPSTFDFRLAKGSPACGAGKMFPDVTDDYNGAPRQNPPSIGAYEVPAVMLFEHVGVK